MLVTSVAPHNVENQQRAIESWRNLGFSVTSLNSEDEANQLRPLFEGVEFSLVARDARAECGKPLVYLNDVFAFLRQSGTPVCGVINSDIHLRATPATIRHLLDEAKDSLVFANRVDVDTLESTTGEVFSRGFDVFFFDRAITKYLPLTRFCLGQPWWDYWLPSCMFKVPSIRLKLLAFPLALHVRHALNWHLDNFDKYGLHFVQCFEPEVYRRMLGEAPEKQKESMRSYNAQVLAMIWLRSQWLSCLPDCVERAVPGLHP
jgi:hypothetical protein